MKYITALLFFSQVLFGQQPEGQLAGIWEVTEVTVGDNVMTPIAKWMHFKEDQSYLSGNGWQQHTVGNWEIAPGSRLLTVENTNGVKDEYGPFRIEIDENEMTMEREEDGMDVLVSLKRISELPMTHGDKLMGLWKVVEVNIGEKGKSLTVPGDVFFVRWDRRFVFQGKDERHTGIWHVHAHRPQVRLFSDSNEAYDSSWIIGFSDENMIWQEESEDGTELIFTRIHEFSE